MWSALLPIAAILKNWINGNKDKTIKNKKIENKKNEKWNEI